jgi:hypothetical protein
MVHCGVKNNQPPSQMKKPPSGGFFTGGEGGIPPLITVYWKLINYKFPVSLVATQLKEQFQKNIFKSWNFKGNIWLARKTYPAQLPSGQIVYGLQITFVGWI